MEPLGFELGYAGRADVARERDHPYALGNLGEILESRDDLALGLLVVLEQDHGGSLDQNTEIRSPTCRSTSGRLGLPVGSLPVTCANNAESANSRSACTRFGTYGCDRNSSA